MSDLHVWTITSGLVALSAHVSAPAAVRSAVVVERLRQTLHERFHIDHITIEVDEGHCAHELRV